MQLICQQSLALAALYSDPLDFPRHRNRNRHLEKNLPPPLGGCLEALLFEVNRDRILEFEIRQDRLRCLCQTSE